MEDLKAVCLRECSTYWEKLNLVADLVEDILDRLVRQVGHLVGRLADRLVGHLVDHLVLHVVAFASSGKPSRKLLMGTWSDLVGHLDEHLDHVSVPHFQLPPCWRTPKTRRGLLEVLYEGNHGLGEVVPSSS